MWSKLGLTATLAAYLALAAFIPATASTNASYQIAVTESATTMVYGGKAPLIQATLTVPPDDPGPSLLDFYVRVDSVRYLGSLSGSSPSYTLNVVGLDPIPSVGQHAVVAEYLSRKNGLVTSAPVILTVQKQTPVVICSIDNAATTYRANTLLTIRVMFGNTFVPVDIVNGSFSITFAGVRTFTSPPLRASSTGQVTVSAPSINGVYQAKCAFSGTSSFNPTEARLATSTIIVSGNNQVGGIAVYTNPTPVRSGVATTWKVVVYARAGLPAPTGYVGLVVGGAVGTAVPLGPGGSVTFQAVAPAIGPSSIIRADYLGDPVYGVFSAEFPLKTPPIPNEVPSGAATAAPTPTATPDPTPTPTATPTASAVSLALPSPTNRLDVALVGTGAPTATDRGAGLRLAGALTALALVGLGAGLVWRRRKRS
jgi:hypothetical protein